MRFRVEWSQDGVVEDSWREIGVTDAQGNDACLAAVSKVGRFSGHYRVSPADLPGEPAEYYFMDARRQVERPRV
jgi:hypothetical protein